MCKDRPATASLVLDKAWQILRPDDRAIGRIQAHQLTAVTDQEDAVACGPDSVDRTFIGGPAAFTGGGVKGGLSYGATDAHGYEAVENKMHIHDWHATILHLLGFDHEKLTFRHASREMRLTEVHGTVAEEILT